MKYFRWSHDEIINMSWDNYMMYLVSIPVSSSDDDKNKDKDDDTVDGGSMDLFDMG